MKYVKGQHLHEDHKKHKCSAHQPKHIPLPLPSSYPPPQPHRLRHTFANTTHTLSHTTLHLQNPVVLYCERMVAMSPSSTAQLLNSVSCLAVVVSEITFSHYTPSLTESRSLPLPPASPFLLVPCLSPSSLFVIKIIKCASQCCSYSALVLSSFLYVANTTESNV